MAQDMPPSGGYGPIQYKVCSEQESSPKRMPIPKPRDPELRQQRSQKAAEREYDQGVEMPALPLLFLVGQNCRSLSPALSGSPVKITSGVASTVADYFVECRAKLQLKLALNSWASRRAFIPLAPPSRNAKRLGQRQATK